MRRLIFVHGINNERWSRDEIQATWAKALRDKLGGAANAWWDDVEIRTAYYADVLAQEAAEWPVLEVAGIRMSAEAPDAAYAADEVAALYLELQRAEGVTDEQVAAELDPGDEPAAAARMAAGIHKKWLKAITRALEKVVPSAGNGLARLFLEQAATYLNKPQVFDRVNAIVRDQVMDDLGDTSKTVVIGHSLGTIVTYVLLRQMRGARIPLFVTLGSPLGIDIVKKRIGPVYVTPPPVASWVNGSDREDFVALHPALSDKTFGPATVENFPDLDNGQEDAHSVVKYLSQQPIAAAILGTLG